MKKILILLFMFIVIISGGISLSSARMVDQGPLVIENKPILNGPPPILQDGEVLLPLSIIKDNIDSTVYYEKNTGKIIFTTDEKVISMNTEKLTAMVNAKPVALNIPARLVNETPYIPIQFLSEFLKINVAYHKQANRVIIDFKKEQYKEGITTKNKLDIKANPSVFSGSVAIKLPKGTKLVVYDKKGRYLQVRTPDGAVGYIATKYITTSEKKTNYIAPKKKDIWKTPNGKLNLTWEYVYKTTPSPDKLKTISGLDIFTPTWFYISDKEGNVGNKASRSYSDWAHKNGYQVWGMTTNSFDQDLTKAVLRSGDLREKVIRQLMIYAQLYDLDGINIDFENVYGEDREFLTQFIRELAPFCKEQNLVLSMDVGAPSNYKLTGQAFDHAALSQSVDYLILMAYDQHWSTCPTAGSTAEYGWVESCIQKTLNAGVPNDKLILGIPLYTRLWKETNVNGQRKVSSKALSMEDAAQIIAKRNITPLWDNKSKQLYVQYTENENTYKIWIENAMSLNLKSSLALKYDLAGLASWRRGFETNDIWQVLKTNLKIAKSYEDWQKNYK